MTWNPNKHAVSVILRPDPGGMGRTTISVRHPTAPYTDHFFYATDPENSDIYELVKGYLESLTGLSAAGKIQNVGFSLAPSGEKVACLPLKDALSPWKTSFWFGITHEAQTEHTLVVLAASTSICDEGADKGGIRVVAHLSEGRNMASITSMSAYLPKDPEDPGKNAIVHLKEGRRIKALVQAPRRVTNNIDIKHSREPASSGPPEGIKLRSPTGKETRLKDFFDPKQEHSREPTDANHEFCRHEPSRFGRRDIDIEAYDEAAVQRIGISGEVVERNPPANVQVLRSDRFSAEKAYYNSKLLFELFNRYHITADRYFRSAELPLLIHYRSGMPYGPGKDGQTVNAAVQPDTWSRHQIAPRLCQSPPKLHMHFALANRSHRGREKWNGERRSPAEPMGIVADPRWVWHEFGHVLLMATTGELELRFAHSPGDALAAIVADPGSSFVETTDNPDKDEEEKKRRWRGATFPWVYLPRRHDRCVKRGWSWSGAMHKPLRELPDAKQPRRKGYRSEQILSTSLFRLYLCLGGMTPNHRTLPDDEPDVPQQLRQAASDYTLYLVMKGLGLLGDARIVAANHPDQLVSALIDADIGTQEFHITSSKTQPFEIGPFPGGFAHKVIRWAFEAQGLYADGTIDNNDKGEPPAVDIYIEDRRPTSEKWCNDRVDCGKGSYVPVSLEGPTTTDGAVRPLWFSDAITVKKEKGEVWVKVSNRGTQKAEDVSVSVYIAEWVTGDDLPKWDPEDSSGVWTKFGEQTKAAINKYASMGPFFWQPFEKKAYVILAAATCAADRANTDQESHLPCSRGTMPLADLVANDNNLGLTIWPPQ